MRQRQTGGVAPTLSVGEVARRGGVAVSTLHFYESRGLIASTRTPGNQRRYPRAVLRRLAFIRVAQRVGVSLGDIAAALATLPAGRTPNRRDWSRLSRAWRPGLDERIAQLRKLRDTLDDCIGCGCLSLDRCRLRNPADRLGAKGPGAHRLLVGPSAASSAAGRGADRRPRSLDGLPARPYLGRSS